MAKAIPFELQEAMGDRDGSVLGDPGQVARSHARCSRSIGVRHIYMYAVETFRLPEPERQGFHDVIGKALAEHSRITSDLAAPRWAERAGLRGAAHRRR